MYALLALVSTDDLAQPYSPLFLVVAAIGLVAFVALVLYWLTVCAIPNQQVGVVEKLWSAKGSVPEGSIIALDGEAGYQADLLRGGLHFGLWRWQYRVHRVPLVTIPQGKVGYVYARDGESLPPSQTLGRVVPCNNFQDAHAFLGEAAEDGAEIVLGQRGRQRAILREGVYAINPALFVVITEDAVYRLPHLLGTREGEVVAGWQQQLSDLDGFTPVVVGAPVRAADPLQPDQTISVDGIAIVTVQDGPSLAPGEIIAPAVGIDTADANYHNNYQDPEAFLRAGGRRGRQYVPLTDGTYFINRWFATVEILPKTVVPIGYVGVVVSYHGKAGRDLSGDSFRHGERVAEGERGVWERPLGPGKYPFNTYAGNVILVPTTNFVLHWITGKSEAHRYDESLRSIDLVTKDAYEPMLPLSVVVHIDYQRAPSVIQRFGDVKKLITQTLDPMLERLLPRRGPQEDDAGASAHARRHPGGIARRAAAEVPRLRHRVRGRAHRQARHGGGGRQDRDPVGAIAYPPTVHRAAGDLRAAAGVVGETADAERGPGPDGDADAVDQRPRAGADRREPGRGRFGPRPQAGGADGGERRGGAGPVAPAGRNGGGGRRRRTGPLAPAGGADGAHGGGGESAARPDRPG